MNRKERRRQKKAASRSALSFVPAPQPASREVANLMQRAVNDHRNGRLSEAVAAYNQILSLDPAFADAKHLLGVVALQSGRLDEAETRIRSAIELQPRDGEYWNNLGVALKRMGRFRAALDAYAEAVTWSAESIDYWVNFADCARLVSLESYDRKLYDLVLAGFSRSDIDHRSLTELATSLIRLDPETGILFDIDAFAGSLEEWDRLDTPPGWLSDPLLLAFLHHTIVSHAALENALTRLRTHLLRLAHARSRSSEPSESLETFAAALAIQCFSNEYVFAVGFDEGKQVEALGEQLKDSAGASSEERFRISVYACYSPLHRLPNASDLIVPKASQRDPLSELKRLLISEPLLEDQLRDDIPALGTITDPVSRAVQHQYEENPYPRWRSLDRPKAQPLGHTLKRLFPTIRGIDGVGAAGDKLDVLIAGCGTGRQALASALRYSGSMCLAIDLSQTSLAYARRMAKSAGVGNIEFVQADILALNELDRRFDLVECGGVLHHLDEPLAGWGVLRRLLKPKGWMKIGLYSDLARQTHALAQQFVREGAYEANAAGIRQARRDILSLPSDHPVRAIAKRANFYTLSECRDLIFHVQEHRFTLPEITAALADLDLDFIGFEFLDSVHVQRYRERYPADPDARSLENWHQFEIDHPDTFLGMYQFWVRARS